jgi:hypothetical protein
MGPEPLDLRPPLEVGIHGLHRHREWDTVQTLAADEATGEDVQFVVLPDGEAVLEWDAPPGSFSGPLEPLADGVRRGLAPPFRVRAVRRAHGWVAGGRQIVVVELPIAGGELTFRVSGTERELRVDGWPAVGGAEALERAVETRFRSYFVFGRHLSRSFWEIEVSPL